MKNQGLTYFLYTFLLTYNVIYFFIYLFLQYKVHDLYRLREIINIKYMHSK